MDEVTSRTQPTSRRMASAKPAATTRQTGSSKSPRKPDDSEISAARWAGVGLVIVAIIAATFLAVVSSSDPGSETPPGAAAAATAAATAADTRLPVARPRIKPLETLTSEIEIPVTVDVPEEDLPKRLLTLFVLRGDEELGRKKGPKDGGKVTIHVRLVPGPNELTAVLHGPGGPGPVSEPVLVTYDPDAPGLEITSPKNNHQTGDASVEVTGTSEIGAEILVTNEANGDKKPSIVPASGEFSAKVRLKRGVNRIVVTSKDAAGQSRDRAIKVKRNDGRPTVELKAPARVKKSSLPKEIRVVVDVTDAGGKKMEEAEVYYSLGGPGRTAIAETDVTDAAGRSTWEPTIGPSTSEFVSVEVSVRVTSPTGDSRTERHVIKVE